MLTLSTILKHYKRKDVQEALVEHARDREVAVRFQEQFGARPDILQYEEDVLEFAKNGATSFHCSEERWLSPLQLSPSMRQRELDELRAGWDLVLDVDCKNWEYAKIITYMLVRLLRSFGITSISVKFSGNKGFHIGVPFEAFPTKVHGKETRLWFPEGPRRIAQYLVHLLGERFLDMVPEKNVEKLAQSVGVNIRELVVKVCAGCGAETGGNGQRIEFICPQCDARLVSEKEIQYKACEKCGKLMVKHSLVSVVCDRCGGKIAKERMDVTRMMEIDTLLISSRHLYRAPYSLHEKSGLVSVVIEPEQVLQFDRDSARADLVTSVGQFIPRNAKPEEAAHLFLQAFDFTAPQQRESEREAAEVEVPATALPVSSFPQCIQKISLGLEDGRKRAVFVLINFLRSAGWTTEQVEQYVKEWNQKNKPPLRENYIIGQLHYAKGKKPVLPPNCSNLAYYQNMGVKCAENICSRCKNPIQYAKRMVRYKKVEKKGKNRENVELEVGAEQKKRVADERAQTAA